MPDNSKFCQVVRQPVSPEGGGLGLANYTLDRYMEAVKALQEALQRNEQALLPRLYLAASYIKLGQQDDAEWEIEQLKMQVPVLTAFR